MKAKTTVPGQKTPAYKAPYSSVRWFECGLLLIGSNTGERFVEEEDYDGF